MNDINLKEKFIKNSREFIQKHYAEKFALYPEVAYISGSIIEPPLINGKRVEMQESKITFHAEDGTPFYSFKEPLDSPKFPFEEVKIWTKENEAYHTFLNIKTPWNIGDKYILYGYR